MMGGAFPGELLCPHCSRWVGRSGEGHGAAPCGEAGQTLQEQREQLAEVGGGLQARAQHEQWLECEGTRQSLAMEDRGLRVSRGESVWVGGCAGGAGWAVLLGPL